MILTSPSFKHNEKIPVQFTGDDKDINPALEINDIPKDTKSFVLIVDDPDAPVGSWDHWIVFNINPEVRRIFEDSIPEGGIQGQNSWGTSDYRGPKPPSGTHRYFFKIFALDTKLGLNRGDSKEQIEGAMSEHILDKAELIGLYR
jgi:Raf kinase inhibitor-like YbhB/YbcL family protein